MSGMLTCSCSASLLPADMLSRRATPRKKGRRKKGGRAKRKRRTPTALLQRRNKEKRKKKATNEKKKQKETKAEKGLLLCVLFASLFCGAVLEGQHSLSLSNGRVCSFVSSFESGTGTGDRTKQDKETVTLVFVFAFIFEREKKGGRESYCGGFGLWGKGEV